MNKMGYYSEVHIISETFLSKSVCYSRKDSFQLLTHRYVKPKHNPIIYPGRVQTPKSSKRIPNTHSIVRSCYGHNCHMH